MYKEIKVYETPEFIKSANKLLTQKELKDVKHYLKENLLIGESVKDYSGLLHTGFITDKNIDVIYLLSKDLNFMALVEIISSNDEIALVDDDDCKKSKFTLNDLKKLGIGFLIKEILSFIKKTIE